MALLNACDVLHQVYDYHSLVFDDSNYDYDWRALPEAYDILAPSSSIMMIIQLFDLYRSLPLSPPSAVQWRSPIVFVGRRFKMRGILFKKNA